MFGWATEERLVVEEVAVVVVGAGGTVVEVVVVVAKLGAALEMVAVMAVDEVRPESLLAASPEEATPKVTTSATSMVLTVRTVGMRCRVLSGLFPPSSGTGIGPGLRTPIRAIRRCQPIGALSGHDSLNLSKRLPSGGLGSLTAGVSDAGASGEGST
jgi:hypothetical protein